MDTWLRVVKTGYFGSICSPHPYIITIAEWTRHTLVTYLQGTIGTGIRWCHMYIIHLYIERLRALRHVALQAT